MADLHQLGDDGYRVVVEEVDDQFTMSIVLLVQGQEFVRRKFNGGYLPLGPHSIALQLLAEAICRYKNVGGMPDAVQPIIQALLYDAVPLNQEGLQYCGTLLADVNEHLFYDKELDYFARVVDGKGGFVDTMSPFELTQFMFYEDHSFDGWVLPEKESGKAD